MVSAHDPENGPGTSGPGNSRPSLTGPRKPAGTAADQQVSRLVTPETTEKPGRSEYQDNYPGISDKSYQAKRRPPASERPCALVIAPTSLPRTDSTRVGLVVTATVRELREHHQGASVNGSGLGE